MSRPVAISLLDPQPLPPPNPWPKRLALAAVLLAVVGGLLYWQFRYYPEKKQVERFMEALKAGDYRAAYRIWKPTPSYRFEDFLEDWGETTAIGRVRSYEIVGVESSRALLLQVPVEGGERRRTLQVEGGSSGVIVLVRINGVDPPERIWVERKDKSLSFPPF